MGLAPCGPFLRLATLARHRTCVMGPRASRGGAGRPHPRGEPMGAATILLVDDDETLSRVLRRVLVQQGYTVVEAGTVAGALQVARETPPQLGLLDLRLPDGDGVELARKLTAEGCQFPVILMTAYPLR